MHATPALFTLVSRRLTRAALLGAALLGASALAQTNYTPYAITTLAGTAGGNSYLDATGPAARFSYPTGVAVDGQGNVYVADRKNEAVRMVTSAGVVTTVATGITSGTGSGTHFGILGGIAIDASGQNLYVTDYSSGAVYKVTTAGVATLFLASGTLLNPYGIAVDSAGNVYVADSANYVVRKITSGGVASVLAGQVGNGGFANGTGTAAQFGYPVGIAADTSGNLYVTDSSSDIVRKIVVSTGVVSTYAGQPTNLGTVDGTLATGQFNSPSGIAIDSSGNVFVTDSKWMVREITAGGLVNSLAGSTTRGGDTDATGSSALFQFDSPELAGIAVDAAGNLYIADTSNDTIRKGVRSSAVPPTISTQPQSQTVAIGGSVTLSVVVAGTGPFNYQWNAGGGPPPRTPSTNSSYVITNATAGDAGTYQVIVTGAGGTVFSGYATVTVTSAPPVIPPRLTNLSVGSVIQTSLSVGFVLGGAGTSGSANLLIRASGPALTAFGISPVMPDPTLTIVQQSTHTTVAADAGWGTPSSNIALVQSADAATGAFALTNTASLDSALVTSLATSPGGYSAVVAGASGDSGNVITEVYDATPNFNGSTPRLVNLSCEAAVVQNGNLTVGFVISGPETLLVRATGPALAAFGVANVMPDPQISVQPLGSSTVLATNAGWGSNAAAITAADNSTGAFALTDPTSKDSAVVLTLSPGNYPAAYTAVVSSVTGTAGTTIVEIYEVP